MLPTFRSLDELASEIVREMEQSRPRLQAALLEIEEKLHDVEAEKRRIESELNATHLGQETLVHYRTHPAVENQCPRCWLRDKVISPMASMSAADVEDNPLRYDAFKCHNCGLEALIGA